MVVDYATNDICRIQLPSMAPEKETPGASSNKAMDDFILDFGATRRAGKELNRRMWFSGGNSVSTVECENVTLSEVLNAKRLTGVTVTFKTETCQYPSPR